MREFEFDALLDEVLHEKVQAEPRPGMELRILARVEEERGQRRGWALGWWLGAASLAACLVVAVAVHQHAGVTQGTQVPVPQIVRGATTSATADHRDEVPVAQIAQKESPQPRAMKRISRVPSEEKGSVVEQARDERLPKMDTFPAMAQKGDLLGQSLRAAEAMQELKAEQERPLEIAAIEIQPL